MISRNSSIMRYSCYLTLVLTLSSCGYRLVPLSLDRRVGLTENEKVVVHMWDGKKLTLQAFWVSSDSLGGKKIPVVEAGALVSSGRSEPVAFLLADVDRIEVQQEQVNTLGVIALWTTVTLFFGATIRKARHVDR